MRIIIVANSPFKTFDNYQYCEDDYLIGVDGGATDIIDRKMPLHLAIGDFDTTKRAAEIKEKADKYLYHSPIKDEIDLELALKYLVENELNCYNVYIYNATMGRMDHELITIKLLIKYAALPLIIVNKSEMIRYIDKTTIIEGAHKRFSLIPLENVCLSVTGAKYNLANALLTLYDNYTSSNETINNAIIEIKSGGVILIEEWHK